MRAWVLLAVLQACGFHTGSSAGDGDGASAPIDTAIDVASVVDVLPDAPPPPRTLDPLTDWEISSDGGTTWAAVTLPSVNWGCNNCSRLFRTTIAGVPTSVRLKFAADNYARMKVNGTVVYDEYWLAGYCTDQPCCAHCCDSADHCGASISTEKTLDATKLALFTAGSNSVVWEVFQEAGGSGFTTTMTVAYTP